jgi:hypothetical protein
MAVEHPGPDDSLTVPMGVDAPGQPPGPTVTPSQGPDVDLTDPPGPGLGQRVRETLIAHPDWSLRQVAASCGASRALVVKWRHRVQGTRPRPKLPPEPPVDPVLLRICVALEAIAQELGALRADEAKRGRFSLRA